MLEILLIRHGQTDWNRERRIMGDQPIGLNEEGRAQVQGLHHLISEVPLLRLYSSPILRARETAETINQKHQLPIQLEPALKEIEYGEWIGKTFHEVRSDPNYNPYFRDEHAPVGVTGESLRQVCDRGVQFIESLRKEELVGKIALVSHADWIKCILLHYLEKPLSHLYQLRIDNASISYLLFEKNTARVIAVNAATTIESLLLPRGPL